MSICLLNCKSPFRNTSCQEVEFVVIPDRKGPLLPSVKNEPLLCEGITTMSLQWVCVSSREFLFGGLTGAFVWKVSSGVDFCQSPLLSEYIHYNRKLNITY